MNELQTLVGRLKRFTEGKYEDVHPMDKSEAILIIPLIEAHLQANTEYTHEQKVQMVSNREASVFHDDRQAIEKAMKVCFPNDRLGLEHLLKYNFSYYRKLMGSARFIAHSHNQLPKSFLASKFFETSMD